MAGDSSSDSDNEDLSSRVRRLAHGAKKRKRPGEAAPPAAAAAAAVTAAAPAPRRGKRARVERDVVLELRSAALTPVRANEGVSSALGLTRGVGGNALVRHARTRLAGVRVGDVGAREALVTEALAEWRRVSLTCASFAEEVAGFAHSFYPAGTNHTPHIPLVDEVMVRFVLFHPEHARTVLGAVLARLVAAPADVDIHTRTPPCGALISIFSPDVLSPAGGVLAERTRHALVEMLRVLAHSSGESTRLHGVWSLCVSSADAEVQRAFVEEFVRDLVRQRGRFRAHLAHLAGLAEHQPKSVAAAVAPVLIRDALGTAVELAGDGFSVLAKFATHSPAHEVRAAMQHVIERATDAGDVVRKVVLLLRVWPADVWWHAVVPALLHDVQASAVAGAPVQPHDVQPPAGGCVGLRVFRALLASHAVHVLGTAAQPRMAALVAAVGACSAPAAQAVLEAWGQWWRGDDNTGVQWAHVSALVQSRQHAPAFLCAWAGRVLEVLLARPGWHRPALALLPTLRGDVQRPVVACIVRHTREAHGDVLLHVLQLCVATHTSLQRAHIPHDALQLLVSVLVESGMGALGGGGRAAAWLAALLRAATCTRERGVVAQCVQLARELHAQHGAVAWTGATLHALAELLAHDEHTPHKLAADVIASGAELAGRLVRIAWDVVEHASGGGAVVWDVGGHASGGAVACERLCNTIVAAVHAHGSLAPHAVALVQPNGSACTAQALVLLTRLLALDSVQVPVAVVMMMLTSLHLHAPSRHVLAQLMLLYACSKRAALRGVCDAHMHVVKGLAAAPDTAVASLAKAVGVSAKHK